MTTHAASIGCGSTVPWSRCRAHGIEPILDLFHFGLPDDILAVGDPRLPGRYEAYTAAVAERYPWVRYYTPVNEPFVTAWLSAKEGLWNERRHDDVAFVAALDNVVTCVILGMKRISERRPDAIFVQSDACDSYRALDPASVEQASFLTERSYVAYDLTYGRRPSQIILHWLRANGMSNERLAWFAEQGTSERCIIGHDYYRGNERLIEDRRGVRRAGPQRRGFQTLALDFHARYDLPFMLCETNIAGTHAPGWLAEVWNDALDLKDQGAAHPGVLLVRLRRSRRLGYPPHPQPRQGQHLRPRRPGPSPPRRGAAIPTVGHSGPGRPLPTLGAQESIGSRVARPMRGPRARTTAPCRTESSVK